MELFPRLLRPAPSPLGFYFRPGRNDHKAILQVLSEGDSAMSGVVFDPRLGDRQRELLTEVRRQNFEAVLDPLSLELSAPGIFDERLSTLPWASPDPHRPSDLKGRTGEAFVDALANFVAKHGFKSVLAPAHYLADSSDAWFEIDRYLTRSLRQRLDAAGLHSVPIYYPLSVSGSAMRGGADRQALIMALQSVPIDAIWLRVHPFGAGNSGPVALRGYIEACRDLQRLNVPLIAERTGSLGMALLAFGAASGLEEGVTLGGDFEVTRLLRPRKAGKGFLQPPRVYIPALGAFLTQKQARNFFDVRQMKAAFGCRDERCCRRGSSDMLNDPRRHYLITRMKEVSRLSRVPGSHRAAQYLDDFLRPATDLALLAVRVEPALKPVQKRLESWRLVLSAFARSQPPKTFPAVPEGRRIEHRRGA